MVIFSFGTLIIRVEHAVMFDIDTDLHRSVGKFSGTDTKIQTAHQCFCCTKCIDNIRSWYFVCQKTVLFAFAVRKFHINLRLFVWHAFQISPAFDVIEPLIGSRHTIQLHVQVLALLMLLRGRHMDDITLQFVFSVFDDHAFFFQRREIFKQNIPRTFGWEDQFPANGKCLFIFPSPDAKIINLACNVFFLTQTFPAAFLPLFKGKLCILFLTELIFVIQKNDRRAGIIEIMNGCDHRDSETLCRKIKLQRKILRMLDMHHINVKCQQDLFIDLSHLFITENRKLRCFANFKFQGDHIFVRVDRQS